MNLAWEGETLSDVAAVSGGSGRYEVESPKGVSGTVENGKLTISVPGPGSYDLTVTDMCVAGERQTVEVSTDLQLTHQGFLQRRIYLISYAERSHSIVRDLRLFSESLRYCKE